MAFWYKSEILAYKTEGRLSRKTCGQKVRDDQNVPPTGPVIEAAQSAGLHQVRNTTGPNWVWQREFDREERTLGFAPCSTEQH